MSYYKLLPVDVYGHFFMYVVSKPEACILPYKEGAHAVHLKV